MLTDMVCWVASAVRLTRSRCARLALCRRCLDTPRTTILWDLTTPIPCTLCSSPFVHLRHRVNECVDVLGFVVCLFLLLCGGMVVGTWRTPVTKTLSSLRAITTACAHSFSLIRYLPGSFLSFRFVVLFALARDVWLGHPRSCLWSFVLTRTDELACAACAADEGRYRSFSITRCSQMRTWPGPSSR